LILYPHWLFVLDFFSCKGAKARSNFSIDEKYRLEQLRLIKRKDLAKIRNEVLLEEAAGRRLEWDGREDELNSLERELNKKLKAVDQLQASILDDNVSREELQRQVKEVEPSIAPTIVPTDLKFYGGGKAVPISSDGEDSLQSPDNVEGVLSEPLENGGEELNGIPENEDYTSRESVTSTADQPPLSERDEKVMWRKSEQGEPMRSSDNHKDNEARERIEILWAEVNKIKNGESRYPSSVPNEFSFKESHVMNNRSWKFLPKDLVEICLTIDVENKGYKEMASLLTTARAKNAALIELGDTIIRLGGDEKSIMPAQLELSDSIKTLRGYLSEMELL
jgi:hypothetical protein